MACHRRKIFFTVVLVVSLLAQQSSAFPAWAFIQNTIVQSFHILSFGVIGLVEITSVLIAAMVKANPCVYAGPLPTDECSTVLGDIPVDATIRGMNVLLIRSFMPFYVSLFLLLGLYMILMQGSPKGRAQAKAFFVDLIVGMILVATSPILFQIILNISSAVSEYVWSESGVNLEDMKDWWETGPDTRTYCCFFFISLASTVSAFIVAVFRYFMVMLFAAMFPLAVFLYSFRFTKGMGNTLMRFSFLAIFSQVVMMLFLVLGVKAYQDSTLGIPAFRVLFGIAAMTALCSTPLIMLKVMHWLGGAVYAYSSRGGGEGIRMVSQLMRGRDLATAIVTAGGRYQTTHTLGMYEAGGERMKSPGWGQMADGLGERPGFPHRGAIGGGEAYDRGHRKGRLRTGSSLVALMGGTSGLEGSAVSPGLAPSPGLPIGGVTPKATRRLNFPPPLPLSTPSSKSSGGVRHAAAKISPHFLQPSDSTSIGAGVSLSKQSTKPIQIKSGKGVVQPGSSKPIRMPRKVDPRKAAGDAQSAGRASASKAVEGIGSRIGAINKDANARIDAARRAANKQMNSLRYGESPLVAQQEGGEDVGEPQVPEGLFNSMKYKKPRTPPKPTPQPETPPQPGYKRPPPWFNEAKKLGIANKNMKHLAQMSHTKAQQTLRGLEKASEKHGKSPDELLTKSMKRERVEGKTPSPRRTPAKPSPRRTPPTEHGIPTGPARPRTVHEMHDHLKTHGATRSDRVNMTEELLQRKLSSREEKSVLKAHDVGGKIDDLTGREKIAKGREMLGTFRDEYEGRGLPKDEARSQARSDVQKIMDAGIAGYGFGEFQEFDETKKSKYYGRPIEPDDFLEHPKVFGTVGSRDELHPRKHADRPIEPRDFIKPSKQLDELDDTYEGVKGEGMKPPYPPPKSKPDRPGPPIKPEDFGLPESPKPSGKPLRDPFEVQPSKTKPTPRRDPGKPSRAPLKPPQLNDLPDSTQPLSEMKPEDMVHYDGEHWYGFTGYDTKHPEYHLYKTNDEALKTSENSIEMAKVMDIPDYKPKDPGILYASKDERENTIRATEPEQLVSTDGKDWFVNMNPHVSVEDTHKPEKVGSKEEAFKIANEVINPDVGATSKSYGTPEPTHARPGPQPPKTGKTPIQPPSPLPDVSGDSSYSFSVEPKFSEEERRGRKENLAKHLVDLEDSDPKVSNFLSRGYHRIQQHEKRGKLGEADSELDALGGAATRITEIKRREKAIAKHRAKLQDPKSGGSDPDYSRRAIQRLQDEIDKRKPIRDKKLTAYHELTGVEIPESLRPVSVLAQPQSHPPSGLPTPQEGVPSTQSPSPLPSGPPAPPTPLTKKEYDKNRRIVGGKLGTEVLNEFDEVFKNEPELKQHGVMKNISALREKIDPAKLMSLMRELKVSKNPEWALRMKALETEKPKPKPPVTTRARPGPQPTELKLKPSEPKLKPSEPKLKPSEPKLKPSEPKPEFAGESESRRKSPTTPEKPSEPVKSRRERAIEKGDVVPETPAAGKKPGEDLSKKGKDVDLRKQQIKVKIDRLKQRRDQIRSMGGDFKNLDTHISSLSSMLGRNLTNADYARMKSIGNMGVIEADNKYNEAKKKKSER